jgi:hypothetical protein
MWVLLGTATGAPVTVPGAWSGSEDDDAGVCIAFRSREELDAFEAREVVKFAAWETPTWVRFEVPDARIPFVRAEAAEKEAAPEAAKPRRFHPMAVAFTKVASGDAADTAQETAPAPETTEDFAARLRRRRPRRGRRRPSRSTCTTSRTS